MKIAQSANSDQSLRRLWTLPATLACVIFGSYQCAQWVINDDLQGMAYAGLIFIGGAIVILILNDWRKGLYFFLAWLLFEDFARKFLGNNMAIYFAKDFLLLVVYISFFADCRKRKVKLVKAPFIVPVLLFIWFGAMQIFNPGSTSIWYGLMGFKIFFYYVPLIFVGYELFSSEFELRRFFVINLALGFVIMGLGIAQAIIGPSFLNPAHQAQDLAALSGLYRVSEQGLLAYRPTSVFVSAGRFCDYIAVAWPLVLGFGGFAIIRQKKGRALVFLCVVVTAGAAFLTSSRGTFMWAMIGGVAVSLAFIWGAPWRQGEARRAFRGVQRAFLAIAGAIVLLSLVFPDAVLSRVAVYQETLDPRRSTNELAHRGWEYPVANFLGAFQSPRWVEGYGIGTTALGGQYIARFFKVTPPTVGVESGFGTLIVEMGIGGLLLWLAMSTKILVDAWKVVKKLRGSPLFPIAFVIFWYAFVLLLPGAFAGIQGYEDFVLNSFLWLLLGILLRLPKMVLAPIAGVQRRRLIPRVSLFPRGSRIHDHGRGVAPQAPLVSEP